MCKAGTISERSDRHFPLCHMTQLLKPSAVSIRDRTNNEGHSSGQMGPWATLDTLDRFTFVSKNFVFFYLLTYSTLQGPSCEANWFAASQEIPRISRNPKVHYRTHKRPPPVSIWGQPNLVHIFTSHLLEIRPNIIHPSTPRSPQWSLSLRFPHQDPIHPPLLTHTRHMPSPSHSSRFYHLHNIG